MTEAWVQQEQGGFAAAAAPHDGVTAGTLLRRAREAAGLHVAALAVSLKVPVRKLEALEADRYDLLTDTVFIRALASSVCRTLKIDPQPVLERLPQSAAPRLVRDCDGINAPFRAPSDGAAPSWLDQLSRPVFLAVFGLLLGALVLILLPTGQTGDAPAQVTPGQVISAPVSAQVIAAPAVSVPPPTEAATTVTTPVASPVAATPPASPVPAAAPVTTVPVTAPAVAAPVTPTAANGVVIIRAKGESWIEVTDAKGIVAVRKVLAAGEAAGASGALPLQVTIGRVDVTEVQVRGKPFDLRPVSKDNVARFEVK